MFGFLKRIFGGSGDNGSDAGRFGLAELARRLKLDAQLLDNVSISYSQFEIPKRTGREMRTILAPNPDLKRVQRIILRRLLGKLKAHPCATGFERGHSIVTNALPHVGQELLIRLDVQDFFGTTKAKRVEAYFRHIGWNREAAALLTKICTYKGALPQGAPTSPRLSNLVNYQLDARLSGLAAARGFAYSRYADDITFSGPSMQPNGSPSNEIIVHAEMTVGDYDYALHTKKKLRISRKHDRQIVTGIVVNDRPNLPRKTRRWLRAVRHRASKNGNATLTEQQLAGWTALERMVATQSAS